MMLCSIPIGQDRNVTIRLLSLPFRQSTSITDDVEGCESPSGIFVCTGETVLSDNITLGPDQPVNITSTEYLDHFVIWPESSLHPFISFGLSRRSITAIDIHLLSYSSESFGVPKFQLYQIPDAAITNASDSRAQTVEYDLLNNDQLNLFDSFVRKITLRPRVPFSSEGVLLTWTFTDLYGVAFFAVSEIGFRHEAIDFIPGEVVFLSPVNDTPEVFQPNAEALSNGSVVLICTVASQGSFTWQWRKDGELITGDDISIQSAEATRTSFLWLTFNRLNFNQSGMYSCTASFSFPGGSNETRSHSIVFPGKIR